MAAGRLLHSLQERGFEGKIIVASDETHVAYNRVLLPDYLAGDCDFADLSSSFSADALDLELMCESRVSEVDLEARVAWFEDRRHVCFQRLVFATGSQVPRPSVRDAPVDRVCELRNLTDARRLRALSGVAQRCMVVGGGLLGLEAADALCRLGVKVILVHRGPRLMTRQLDEATALLLSAELQRRGIQVILCAVPVHMECDANMRHHVHLDDGNSYQVDFVVFATGAAPADQLALAAGLHCDGGVVTDRYLRCSEPDTFAMGECACVDGQRHQLVDVVNAQASALAATLCGEATELELPAYTTRLKVSDVALVSAGEISAEASAQSITIRDTDAGIYRRLFFDGAVLRGAILFGDTAGAREIGLRLDTKVDEQERERLAFGYA